ncbi:hypothetical protein CISIN_1g035210mg [Citrus sinensis]|uniref:Uncharacterized protein n=1 Tax=Citrus sinensis TaxID=2711 RepID=A0A067GX09_CITSI|nr:hypothetical protein CISIN_1g035210mg [Citrus sinensis]
MIFWFLGAKKKLFQYMAICLTFYLHKHFPLQYFSLIYVHSTTMMEKHNAYAPSCSCYLQHYVIALNCKFF